MTGNRDEVEVLKFAFWTRIWTIFWTILAGILLSDAHYDTSASRGLDRSPTFLDWLLPPLQRWDAIHFEAISAQGYQREQQFAFFPGLPLLVRLASEPLSWVLPSASFNKTFLAGIIISNTAFVLASLTLYRLAVALDLRPRTAKIASILFSISPVSVFLSSLYSESTFALLSLVGFLAFAKNKYFFASLAFGASAGVRSNGILYSGFFLWALIKQKGRMIHLKSLYLILLALLTVTPFLAFQYYGYLQFCSIDQSLPRPWCGSTLIYSFVQEHYWNNGFLRYWTLSQLPNFLLALPTFVLYGLALQEYIGGNLLGFLTLGFRYESTPSRGKSEFASKTELLLPHIYLACFLLAYILFFSHVQIITRFMSWNPIGPLYLASRFNKGGGGKDDWIGRWYVIYSVSFGTLGMVLFSAFLPPA